MGRKYSVQKLQIIKWRASYLIESTGMGTLHAWQSFGDNVAVRILISLVDLWN